MNKKCLIFPLLFLLFDQFTFSQWQTYQTGLNALYSDVSVVNANTIWVCGNTSSSNIIVRSIDAGQSWVNVNPNSQVPDFVEHITAVDINRAWITGGYLSRENVYATINGGLNWVLQDYSPKKYINFIHFFNSNTGIFLADPESISHGIVGFFITRNGGINWYRSVNAPAITSFINDDCMGVLDTNLIWFVNDDSLYKLTGGLDNIWQVYFTGVITAFNSLFINANTGIVTDGANTSAKTTNGGANWSIISDTILGNYSTSMIRVANTEWVIISSGERIRISYDFCNIWQSRVSFRHGYGLDAYDTNSIWLTGKEGKMYRYNFNLIGLKRSGEKIPVKCALYQNYPNPFNPVTKIRFSLPSKGGALDVRLIIYDVLGREVVGLIPPLWGGQEGLAPGTYEVEWNASNYSSGVYYYRLVAGDYSETRKMMLLK